MKLYERLAWLVVAVALIAMIAVGLACNECTVGDETAHYYTMTTQSENLAQVNYVWRVKTEYGQFRSGEGPHTKGWHYLGAVFYRMIPSFSFIQLYHLLFSAQLLIFFLLLVRDWCGDRGEILFASVLGLATLPVFTLFGILMYVDIPMAAQVVTTFYFLNRRKYTPAIIFMVVGLFIKENAFILLPVFFLMLWLRADWKKRYIPVLWTFAAVLAFASTIITIDYFTVKYTSHHEHNELANTFRSVWHELGKRLGGASAPVPAAPAVDTAAVPTSAAAPVQTSANNLVFYYPGDLRLLKNWFIFLGGFGLMMSIGGLGLLLNAKRLYKERPKEALPVFWGLLIAFSYMVPATYMLWNNPDIRYFFPCIPFLVFAFAVGCSYFKYRKHLFIGMSVLLFIQLALVMAKICEMRSFDPDFRQIIAVMKDLKTDDNKNAKVFMYADKWRYVPLEPYWDITQQVWTLDVHGKHQMFKQKDIWFVVVDKSKIANRFDRTSPSRYAEDFVSELDGAPQLFKRLNENNKFIIYRVLDANPVK